MSAGAAEGARWQFAPLGTISNPGGTYGVVDLGSNASKFPGGDDYCRCLNGDVSVSAACAQIGVAVDSGGARETLCKGSFVLRPQDAVVLLACMPPSAEYWGWQTNVLARWGESADQGGEGVYFPQVSYWLPPPCSFHYLTYLSSSPPPRCSSTRLLSSSDVRRPRTSRACRSRAARERP